MSLLLQLWRLLDTRQCRGFLPANVLALVMVDGPAGTYAQLSGQSEPFERLLHSGDAARPLRERVVAVAGAGVHKE